MYPKNDFPANSKFISGFLHQTPPPPKDSQFSVPIKTPVRGLVGRESKRPENFPYYGTGFLKIKEEKNFFSEKKAKKKKKFEILFLQDFPVGISSLWLPNKDASQGFRTRKLAVLGGGSSSQFSVPIKTPVRVLVGREAPGKFSLLWDRIFENKGGKKFFFRKKSKKKKSLRFYSYRISL